MHLVFGLWGLVAYRGYQAAKIYAKSTAILYAAVAVMGLVASLNTTFGLVPLFSHDVWLHFVLAAGAAYFGFVHRDSGAGRDANAAAGA